MGGDALNGQGRQEAPGHRTGFHSHLLMAVLAGVYFLGCSPKKHHTETIQTDDLSIYYVGIAAPRDLFHGVIARGAEQAGKDLGVRVVYIFPDKLTLPQYINRVEQAIAARPDGMVLVGIDEKATESVAQQAREKGIVLAFNPAPPVREHPVRNPDDIYISRVGSDEYSAGRLTGEGLIEAGVGGRVFCGVHMPGDGTLVRRSQGLKDRLAEEGIRTDIAEIPFEPGQAEEYLASYLRRNPDTGAIVTLDSRMSASSRAARKRMQRTDLLLAGFDLDLPTLEAIRDGEMLFTVDQQQFWRGYMPVLAIVHHIRYGLTQANYFLSGPNIINASNVEEVISLVEKGYR